MYTHLIVKFCGFFGLFPPVEGFVLDRFTGKVSLGVVFELRKRGSGVFDDAVDRMPNRFFRFDLERPRLRPTLVHSLFLFLQVARMLQYLLS